MPPAGDGRAGCAGRAARRHGRRGARRRARGAAPVRAGRAACPTADAIEPVSRPALLTCGGPAKPAERPNRPPPPRCGEPGGRLAPPVIEGACTSNRTRAGHGPWFRPAGADRPPVPAPRARRRRPAPRRPAPPCRATEAERGFSRRRRGPMCQKPPPGIRMRVLQTSVVGKAGRTRADSLTAEGKAVGSDMGKSDSWRTRRPRKRGFDDDFPGEGGGWPQ